MGIQHEQPIPPSFADALDHNYLGDPAVSTRLVAAFLAKAEEVIHRRGAGELDAQAGADEFRRLIREYADIVSGRNPAYKPVIGYHSRTLPIKLRADLGEFWQQNRAKWDDDSVCVLFEWLLVTLFDAMKRADGDEMLLGVMLKPSVEYATQVILGTEKRAGL